MPAYAEQTRQYASSSSTRSSISSSSGLPPSPTTSCHSSHASSSTLPVLPVQLPKPAFLIDVDASTIFAQDPTLSEVPAEFIRHQLLSLAPSLLYEPGRLELPHTDTIPAAVVFHPAPGSQVLPTQALAFIRPDLTHIRYCPSWATLFALLSPQYKHLVKAPRGISRPDGTLLLPVIQIPVIDVPDSVLNLLHHYAHTFDPLDLLKKLLPLTEEVPLTIDEYEVEVEEADDQDQLWSDFEEDLIHEVAAVDKQTVVSFFRLHLAKS